MHVNTNSHFDWSIHSLSCCEYSKVMQIVVVGFFYSLSLKRMTTANALVLLYLSFSMLFITETGVCITSGCSILVTLSFHCGNFHFIIDMASTVISFVFTTIAIHSGCIGVWFYFHQVLSYSPDLQTPLTSASFDSRV